MEALLKTLMWVAAINTVFWVFTAHVDLRPSKSGRVIDNLYTLGLGIWAAWLLFR